MNASTNANAGEGRRGLACPKCGQQRFAVVYTRRAFGAKLVRRRRCLDCGRRITTWERAIGSARSDAH